MQEASGQRNDSVGTLHLTDNNTVGQGVGIVQANAALFVSANSEFLSNASFPALGATDYSWSLWFNTATTGANNSILDKTNGGNADFRLYLDISGIINWHGVLGGVATAGTWYHICAMRDQTNSVQRLWVNGVNKGTSALVAGIPDALAFLNIGAALNGSVFYFNGRVEQVGVTPGYVFTASDVAYLYNSGSGRVFGAA
jgi:hypothetical protein